MTLHSWHHAPERLRSWNLTDNPPSKHFWSSSWERRWVSRVFTTNCPRASTFSGSRATATACRRGRSRDSSSRSWRPTSPGENLPSFRFWELPSRLDMPALSCIIKDISQHLKLQELFALLFYSSFVLFVCQTLIHIYQCCTIVMFCHRVVSAVKICSLLLSVQSYSV